MLREQSEEVAGFSDVYKKCIYIEERTVERGWIAIERGW